jgi:transposase
MNWKKLLESVSESMHDQLQLRHDYLVAENRILRHQIDGRVQLTDSERKELAELGAKLGKQALAEIATIAQADTILAWHRKFANQTVTSFAPPQSVGRPHVDQEIEDWVIRMARENRSWGYDRIQGSLKHLGYTISDQTVGNILKRRGIPPAPERQKTVTWGEFVRPHLAVLLATDFFNSNGWSWFRLMISCLLELLHFCGHPVRFVGTVLHHLIQGIRSFGMRCRDLRPPVQQGLYKGKPRFPAMPYGDAVRRIPASELASCDEGRIQSQEQGNVLWLAAIHPHPIRDGPIRRQYCCVWPPNSDGCQAA